MICISLISSTCIELQCLIENLQRSDNVSMFYDLLELISVAFVFMHCTNAARKDAYLRALLVFKAL